MAYRRQQGPRGRAGLKSGISILALIVAVGFLLYQLFSSVLLAFSESSWVGIRSLCAALFPLTIAIYLGFIARLRIPDRDSRAPLINNYIIFLFWTILLLGLDGANRLVRFPLEELLYAATISAMIWRYRSSYRDLAACCYGVLSGLLGAIILFGINPVAL